jgi:hypothetical protein
MPDPKSECEMLLGAVLPFAEQMLRDHGEFHPYGAAMKLDGEIVSVAVYDGREFAPSIDTIKLLKDAFIRAAYERTYKATAHAYDVRVKLPTNGEKSDAVAISLNHEDGYSVVVLFPYKIESGSLYFGEVFAQKGEADIFPQKN